MAPEELHVLAVSHAYPRRSNSGHGIFIHRLHQAMRDLGVRIDVLQLAEWAPPWPLRDLYKPWQDGQARRDDLLDELDGVRVHHPLVVTPRPSRFFPQDTWTRESRTLIRYCMRRDELAAADVVLGHFMVPDGVHALALGSALGLPVAALAWGDDVHAWPEKSATWRDKLVEVLEGIDLPLACSERLAHDGNSWLSVPRNDWQVIYGGIDLEEFTPARDRTAARERTFRSLGFDIERVRVLLMVGQAVPEKGYLELLDAWMSVSEQASEWHLVMIGAKGDLDVPAIVAHRGLTERAHWLGLQAAERMPDLMRAADAFVLPSHNEGLSISVLEALATGVPTVATDVGGHSEVITSAEEGWLIPSKDVNALRDALLELMQSAEQRKRRGAAGRKAAQRVGTPADNARRLVILLHELRKAQSRVAGATN
jgi:teichuronic acid biosynthesis glycosyltransferase TuaC